MPSAAPANVIAEILSLRLTNRPIAVSSWRCASSNLVIVFSANSDLQSGTGWLMISLKNFSLNSILLLPQRFAGPNKQVHLIGLGEVVPRLGRGLEGFHRPVQAVTFVLHSSFHSSMRPRQDRDTTAFKSRDPSFIHTDMETSSWITVTRTS